MTTSSDDDDVSMALKLLRHTVGAKKQRLNDEGAKCMQDGEYDTAVGLIQFAQRLLGFQEEVDSLVEKWEEIQDSQDGGPSNVGQHVGSRFSSRKIPAEVRPIWRNKNLNATDSTLHCFHILEVLKDMGGRASNQDVSMAVNKRIKMLYPKFKQAKVILAQQGWTRNSGSNQSLEISDKGLKWLHTQKAKLTDESHSDQSPTSSKIENGPSPSIETEPETVTKNFNDWKSEQF